MSRPGWTRPAREAVADLLARPGLTLGVLFLAAGMLTVVMCAESSAVVQDRVYADALLQSGQSTLYVQTDPDSPVTLTAADCAGLRVLDGVVAAMWVREVPPLTLWSPAGPQVPVRRLGGDVPAFLARTDAAALARWHGAQVLLDRASPAAAAAVPGEVALTWYSGRAAGSTRALPVRLTALGEGLSGSAVILDATPGPVSACAVLVDPDRRALAQAQVEVGLPAVSGYGRTWALGNADRFPSARSLFVARPSQWYWLVAACVLLAAWALYLRVRRSEFALYAVAGLSPRRLAALVAVDLLAPLLTAGAIAGVVVVGVALRAGTPASDLLVGMHAGARLLITALLCGCALAVHAAISTVGRTLDAIKDR